MTVNYAENPGYPKNDNAVIVLKFKSGAVGTVLYSSMGSKRYPKEQLRVFSNGSVYEMNNYVNMTKYGSVKSKKIKLRQDKGFGDEYKLIFDVINGRRENDTVEDALKAHEMLLKAIQK